MGKTFKFLRFIDLLVTPYDFNVSNNEKSMTVTGGCLSLLIILLMIVYTINYYVKLTTASASIYTGTGAQELESIQLNQQTMAFALELTKTKGSIISYMEGLDQYFTVQAMLIEQTREQGVYGYNRISTQLTPQRCSKEYIEQFNFKSVSFTQQQLDNFICFNGTYYLDGQFYDPKFAYIKLDIIKCQGDNCKSEQEIYDFLDGGVDVDLFIKDTNIKSKYDSTNPAEIFPTNIFWRLTTSVGNNEDIFISPVTIDQVFNKDIPFDGSTINNRLYQSSKVTKQERRQMSFDLQTVTSMCTFYLRMSNSSNNYFVNDTSTLALILSSISEGAGLALAVISVLKILYKFYCEHKTFEIIMNYVFKFDLNHEKPGSNSPVLTDKNVRINKLFGQKITYSFFSFIRFSIKNLFKKIKFLEKCCSQYDKEIILAQMAKTKIQSDLDLAQIVRKLYEIDFIKLFLFDDDQLKLFNTFCQPIFEKTMIKSKDDIKKWVQQPQTDTVIQDFKRTFSKMGEVTAQQIFQTEIPIETRLAKISRFFISQTKINSGQRLLDTYQKIKDNVNVNSQLNKRFINFLKNNKILYNIIETHQRNSRQLQLDEILRSQQTDKKNTYVNKDPIVEDDEEDNENEVDEEMQKSDDRNNVILVDVDSNQVPSQEVHQIINGYQYSGSQNQNDKNSNEQ